MNNKIIFEYLDELIDDPKSELNYSKDYELLIAVMLSAQTTDKRVNLVTKTLFSKYSSLSQLASASIVDVENIVRSLGTYSRKASNVIEISRRLLEEADGCVPSNRDFLESLPGVGRKTANVVLGMLYNEPCIAVDTHVARVSKRLGFANENDSVLQIEKNLYKVVPKGDLLKVHHQLLLFGRYHCKAIKPMCNNCKLYKICKEKRKLVN